MTDLDIVNRALVRIGAAKATSMADTAKNASRAIEAYPGARDEILRMFDWPCISKRLELLDTADVACAWLASREYHEDDLVVNDTGKVYECVTAGTSAGSGGPTGTGTSITDGTCEWDYVDDDDTDVNWAWQASHAYLEGDVCANYDGRVYVCIDAGTSDSSGGPTTTALDITDNDVHWKYYGTIPEENLSGYSYCYLYPPDCLKLVRILDNTLAAPESGKGADKRREGVFIYTDVEDAVAKYIRSCDGPDDPTLWDSLLTRAVVLNLANTICYDITGKADLSSQVSNDFAQTLMMARQTALFEGSDSIAEPTRWEDA